MCRMIPALFSRKALAAVLTAGMLLAGGPAWAQETAEPEPEPVEEPALAGPPAPPPEALPPVYEEQLLRLAEILGSLHVLRALCGDGDANIWKQEMEAVLAAESPGPDRRARLIGRFNHGLETFNATYRSCTPSARRAIRRYLSEGKLLSSDVQARYGQ